MVIVTADRVLAGIRSYAETHGAYPNLRALSRSMACSMSDVISKLEALTQTGRVVRGANATYRLREMPETPAPVATEARVSRRGGINWPDDETFYQEVAALFADPTCKRPIRQLMTRFKAKETNIYHRIRVVCARLGKPSPIRSKAGTVVEIEVAAIGQAPQITAPALPSPPATPAVVVEETAPELEPLSEEANEAGEGQPEVEAPVLLIPEPAAALLRAELQAAQEVANRYVRENLKLKDTVETLRIQCHKAELAQEKLLAAVAQENAELRERIRQLEAAERRPPQVLNLTLSIPLDNLLKAVVVQDGATEATGGRTVVPG